MTKEEFPSWILGMSHEQGLLEYWKLRLQERLDQFECCDHVCDDAEKWMNANILKRIRQLQAFLQKEYQEKMHGLVCAVNLREVPKGFDWNFPQG